MPAIDPTQPTVVLVDPPYYRLYKDSFSLTRYPLSLGYLAGAVRAATEWNVVVYNADFTPDPEPYQISYLSGRGFTRYLQTLRNPHADIWAEVDRTIRRYHPEVVGVSCKSQTFAAAVQVAAVVKRIDPTIRVIVGGPHAAMVGAEILDCPDIDVVVAGEGEQTLVEVLDAIAAGAPLEGIPGTIFRRDGETVTHPPRELIDDLDAMPYPHAAAGDVLHEYELYPPDAFNHVFATRGCPYNCFFCGSRNVWTRRVRHRSADNVVEEVRRLAALGVSSVHFDDDTFGVHPAHIRDLCDGIRTRCGGIPWSCELHVNLIDDDTLAAMAVAGCRSIQIGVESGNDEILRAIRKGITIGKALAACRTVARHGVEVEAFFMVGFPQETEATLADTVAAMKKIRGVLSYSIFTPYPGTEAFEYCRQRGLVGADFDVAMHNHQSPVNCFSEHIAPERFRRLVGRIERRVDRNNWPGPIRRVLSGRESLADILAKAYKRIAGKISAGS